MTRTTRALVTAGCLLSLGFSLLAGRLHGQEDLASLRVEAAEAMRRAATYYRTHVATHGGYVYHYSLDLKQRWGEGLATLDQIWVQPPGTPTVGLALLAAFEATGDAYYLCGMQEAADALRYGQLQSGGWTNCIDFAADGTRQARYRNGQGSGPNNSSLDDGQSQTATRFMLRADQALDFRNAPIHESAQIALDSLLKAQFACGGFPQVWTQPVDQSIPPRQANFPDYDWRTEGRIKEYWTLYTLNDDLAWHVGQTLKAAYEVYQEEQYREALLRLGDFLIIAQMPEPQPAWAQQYNFQMQPVWARRFEPPAIAGHESQQVIELLMDIYLVSGDDKYLAPIPSALAYLKRSQLGDGSLARYYELRSNRPLFMQRQGEDYSLSYDDQDLPSHYGWKFPSRVAELERELATIGKQRGTAAKPVDVKELIPQVRQIVADLDDQGRWVSQAGEERLVGQPKLRGQAYLSSEVFSHHLTTLADFLAATRPQP